MTTPEPLPAHLMTRGSDPTLLRDELLYLIRHRIHNHPRSLQKTIGPSEIGTPCDRRLTHRLNDTPPIQTGSDQWRPTVGTAVHDWLDRAVQHEDPGRNRYATEQRITVGTIANTNITGSSDLYDRITATVIDWKVVGPTTLKKAKTHGPTPTYRTQAHLYGRGFVNAGLPVDVVSIFYLPSNGELAESHFWHEPFDPTVAEAALTRANQIAALVYAFRGHAAAIANTADDYCSNCPWFLPAATDLTEACPGHPAGATAAPMAVTTTRPEAA